MIEHFDNIYFFLTNFHRSPVEYKGKIYPTAEHLFQALKTKNKKVRNNIRRASSPGEAKKLGRTIRLRDDWEEVKDKLMFMVVRLKFLQNPKLNILLKNTKGDLIEGNCWHDNYWGDCLCYKCKKIKGHNQLGKTLMKVRLMV